MGIRRKKTIIDQAADYVEAVGRAPRARRRGARARRRAPTRPARCSPTPGTRPARCWPTPRDKAGAGARRRPRQGGPRCRRPDKAAAIAAVPRPPQAAAGAVAAEKAAEGRDLAAAKVAELKGEPEEEGQQAPQDPAHHRPRRRCSASWPRSCVAAASRTTGSRRTRRRRRRARRPRTTPIFDAAAAGLRRRADGRRRGRRLARRGARRPAEEPHAGHHAGRAGRGGRPRVRRRAGDEAVVQALSRRQERHSSTPGAGREERSSGRFSATQASIRSHQPKSQSIRASRSVGDLLARHLPPAHDDPLVHRQLAPHVADGEQVVEPGVGDQHDVGVRGRVERGEEAAGPRRQHVGHPLGAAGPSAPCPSRRSRSMARCAGARG